MTRQLPVERLLEQLDDVERRIESERVRRGDWKGAFAAFFATINATPVAEYLASRRRLRALEGERDRLLAGVDPQLTRTRDAP